MPTLVRPDIYLSESLTTPVPTLFPATAPGVFMGYCRQGPLTPTQVDSWATYKKLYGPFVGGGDDAMAVAVYNYFLNGGSSCWVLRVIGTGAAIATRTWSDRQGSPQSTLVVNADNAGVWGNTVYVEILDTGVAGRFNIIVRVGANTDAAALYTERWLDLSINPADQRNALTLLNSPVGGSLFVTLAAPNGWTYSNVNQTPAASASPGGDALSGGANNSVFPTLGASGTYANALPSLNGIKTQMLLNIVGVTDANTINAAIAYAAARNDTLLIVDTQLNRSSAQSASDTAAFTPSSYAATYWPGVYCQDPSSSLANAVRQVAPSALVMGVIAANDRNRGAFVSPAGTKASLTGVVSLEGVPTDNDYANVASANVNGIQFFPRYGYCVFGSHTLKPNQADSQISCRRTLMSIEGALKDQLRQYQFENNDALLWGEITSQVDSILRQVWQDNGLVGDNATDAYYIVCDETNNTSATIQAGEVHVEVGVALQFPAQFIVINVGQYDGTVTATNNLAQAA